jgi:hypothetical protein
VPKEWGDKNAYRILVRRFPGRRPPFGRPRRIMKNSIKTDLGRNLYRVVFKRGFEISKNAFY